MANKIGKRVVDELYVHLSGLDQLNDLAQEQRILDAIRYLSTLAERVPNVAKLNLKTGRLSLLAYREFDTDPFPELLVSWTFAPGSADMPSCRIYTDSLNPPILHRKELLVPETYPGREAWGRLTSTAELLGLFDDTTSIGFKRNWERLVASKGYRLAGNEFLPLGNETYRDDAAEPWHGDGPVQRHLTALARNGFSAPLQLLMRHGLLSPGCTFFDYGCGRGGDVANLNANGFDAHGWDPHFAADQPILEADVVNLGFVVNVIEDPAERVEAIHRAFKLTRRVMSIGVMLHGNEPSGRPFRDGFITSRNTFQKYFSQAEFKDYVEEVLHQDVFMAGPGVAFVFSDKDSEQRFHAGRFRSRGVATRLLRLGSPRVHATKEPIERRVKPARPSNSEVEFMKAQRHLDSIWATALDLGRLPEPDEVIDLEEVESQCGSLRKAMRLLACHYDQNLLAKAAATRADDIRLYLAAQQFSKRPTYRQLERRLQRDIKAFFGDYVTAQASGLGLLRDAADPEQLLEACQCAATSGLGWLDGNRSLQLHFSMIERLPVLLRAYMACGLMLWDAISEVQLVKIHIDSGKLTLMEFDDFDTNPLPMLRRRIKVNVRKVDYDLFDYGSPEHPKPFLYRKSRYIGEDYPGYVEQLAFDEALEATGILGNSDFGPSADQLFEELEGRRLSITGMLINRSMRVPELDQACGTNFTFRSFIECGETQQRLGLANVPFNPDTYNALYDLATEILDPVIEYFGAIRLTYGFCSHELSRHITKRVAARLDQHAALETNRTGKLICERGGAACDFYVEDENMRDVADWIITNTPFDRLYFYGSDRPIHVSYSPQGKRQAFQMTETKAGHLIPRPYQR
jgi:DNA phosphorothioation-associated putative methyltransferase